MRAKRFRWTCPQCGSGVLIGQRPRLDATARYCLDCSKKQGVLVKRECPKLEARRAIVKERTAIKAKRERDKSAEKYIIRGEDIRVFYAKAWRAAERIEPRLRDRPALVVRYGNCQTGGRAYFWNNRILINRGSKTCPWPLRSIKNIIVHEIAHFVAYARGDCGHGDKFKAAEAELMQELGRKLSDD